LVIKNLGLDPDPDPDWIRIRIHQKLDPDPDPDSNNPDPQLCRNLFEKKKFLKIGWVLFTTRLLIRIRDFLPDPVPYF